MATEAEIGVHPAHLIELYKMGFRKLVPMSKHGNPIGIPMSKDGVPVIEDGKQKYSWTPIYENPHYWTEETLPKRSVEFKDGVGVCLGDTGLKDEQGNLYDNMLDIDSNAVYDRLLILMNPGPNCSKVKKMFEQGCVVRTRKPKGRHLHWLSHKLYEPIRIESCKEGFEFEIKTGKWCAPLPPTVHRADANFHYNWESKSAIPVSDDFYDIVLDVLKDCLKEKPLNDYQQQQNSKEESEQNTSSDHTSANESKRDSDTGSSGTGTGNGKSDGLELKDQDVERMRSFIQPIYRQGCRNSLVFSLSCVLRKQGFSKDSVIAVIEKLAKHDGISQVADIKKALKQVEDVFKEDIAIIAGNDHLRHVIHSIMGSHGRDKANQIFTRIFKIIHKVRNQIPQDEQQSKEDWLACNVLAEYVCMTTNDNGELFIYDENRGIYLTNQEWRIRQLCRSIANDASTYEINEVINRVKDKTYVDRSKFDADNDIINIRNGLLNIHTFELMEHTPTYLSTMQLPLKYNPKARCPRILRFLSEVLNPEDIRVVLQLIGYCLYKTTRYEKAFIFFGQGSNGKSTLIKLIEYFLGYMRLYKNVSHVSLHDLAKTRFKPAELHGKLANLFADLGNKKINSEHWGTIKTLISGDSMNVERKNRDPFEFTPFAKLIFSCNEIPELPDNTYATWRRLILLEFENVFEDNKDTTLIDKLTTEEEMSGLLNLALQNLRQLIRDNKFAYTKDIETVRRMYEENSNTMARFVQERIEALGANSQELVICRDAYGDYLDLCQTLGKKCKTDAQLGAYLTMALAGKWGGRQKKRINGVQEHVYYGIKLKQREQAMEPKA